MSPVHKEQVSFIRLPRVKQRVGLSRSSIYAMMSRGEFPPPISLGQRAVAWVEADVDEWISSRVEASRSTTVLDGAKR